MVQERQAFHELKKQKRQEEKAQMEAMKEAVEEDSARRAEPKAKFDKQGEEKKAREFSEEQEEAWKRTRGEL